MESNLFCFQGFPRLHHFQGKFQVGSSKGSRSPNLHSVTPWSSQRSGHFGSFQGKKSIPRNSKGSEPERVPEGNVFTTFTTLFVLQCSHSLCMFSISHGDFDLAISFLYHARSAEPETNNNQIWIKPTGQSIWNQTLDLLTRNTIYHTASIFQYIWNTIEIYRNMLKC